MPAKNNWNLLNVLFAGGLALSLKPIHLQNSLFRLLDKSLLETNFSGHLSRRYLILHYAKGKTLANILNTSWADLWTFLKIVKFWRNKSWHKAIASTRCLIFRKRLLRKVNPDKRNRLLIIKMSRPKTASRFLHKKEKPMARNSKKDLFQVNNRAAHWRNHRKVSIFGIPPLPTNLISRSQIANL